MEVVPVTIIVFIDHWIHHHHHHHHHQALARDIELTSWTNDCHLLWSLVISSIPSKSSPSCLCHAWLHQLNVCRKHPWVFSGQLQMGQSDRWWVLNDLESSGNRWPNKHSFHLVIRPYAGNCWVCMQTSALEMCLCHLIHSVMCKAYKPYPSIFLWVTYWAAMSQSNKEECVSLRHYKCTVWCAERCMCASREIAIWLWPDPSTSWFLH